MEPDPTTTSWSSCTLCRCRFPTAEIVEWIGGPGGTPLCPRCGADAVMAGSHSDAELERQHVLGFGGNIVLVDALRGASVPVHGVGLGLTDQEAGLAVNPGTVVVLVGAHAIEVVVDPPGRDRTTWRVRVPTRVVVRVGEADPGRATRMHDAGLAPVLLASGFTLARGDVEVLVTKASERHRAVWECTAVDAADTASVM